MRRVSMRVDRSAFSWLLIGALLGQPSFVASAAELRTNDAHHRTMAAKASQALRAARALPVPDWKETNNLIFEGKFAEFEGRSKEFEKAFQSDPLYESPLFKLYDAIGGSSDRLRVDDAALDAQLGRWVKTRPSYMSLSARGLYRVGRGFEQRGNKWARETPQKDLDQMRRTMETAKQDLLLAQKENPKFPVPYIGLIQIERAIGTVTGATQWMMTASKEIPFNYYVRFVYLETLHPRWGGSYADMELYASSIDRAAAGNARIWSLKGEAAAERGYTSFLADDYKSAIEHYTKALSYGDRRDFYYYRGQSYEQLDQNALALADFKKCLEITGPDPKVEERIRSLPK